MALPPGRREPAALAVLLGFLPPFPQTSWWLPPAPVPAPVGAALAAVVVALLRRGRPAAR